MGSVAVSPDGRNVYVASLRSASVAVFAEYAGQNGVSLIEFEDAEFR